MSKTIFVTVSDDRPFFLKTPESTFGKRPKDGKFGQYQNIIREHLDSNPEFGITDQYHLTHDEFSKTDFYSKNYDFLSDPDPDNNGRAFKPYAIREALRKINDGDYLIYNDCSPTWWTHIDANPTQKIDKKRYNLIGWQNTDIYQNFNITFISSISKNRILPENLFKIPSQD